MIQDEKEIKPRAMNKTELAGLYGVHRSTITAWILRHSKKIGEIEGRLLTPKQIKIFFECVGQP